jgi:spore maturation protein SpmA
MILNYIWISFFVIAFVVGIAKMIFTGDYTIFTEMMNALFAAAKSGFEISLGLTGVLSFWLGFMKIGEKGGTVNALARWCSPVFSRLFPDIPKGHPVNGSIFMNLAANMLNLDNAATPLGLKAIKELQELNEQKDTASRSMIMFMVLNASGLTIIPITLMVYRVQMGAANPADIFIPVLISTLAATLAGLIFVSIKQRINLLDKVLLGFILGAIILIAAIVYWIQSLPQDKISVYSSLVANCLLFTILISFLISGLRKKLNVYELFIEGAKEGFKTAVMIIPYLIAILTGIALLRASGAMDFLTGGLAHLAAFCGLPTDWVNAFPTALMKPLSGSGSRGLMIDAMRTYGADSFVGRLSCIFQGTTDTTFYVVAVYYGAVNIKNSRYTIPAALFADLVGIITAIAVGYLFFYKG